MTNGYSPLNALLNLQRALGLARSSNLFDVGTSGRGVFPPINVFQDDDNYIVVSELPGVPRDSIDVQVHRHRLRISGDKVLDYGEEASIHRRERRAGRFDRTIALPFTINPDSVKAEFRNGILALKLLPPDEERPRTVSVT